MQPSKWAAALFILNQLSRQISKRDLDKAIPRE